MFSNTANMLSVQECQFSELANCLCSLGLGMHSIVSSYEVTSSLGQYTGDCVSETSKGNSSAHWKNGSEWILLIS